MKKTLFAAVSALSMLAAGAALAADLPNRRAAPAAPAFAAPPTFTWTGFYIGANAGYGFGEFSKDGRLFDDADGFVGGGQVGFNYQIGQFVAGLEADLQGADMKAGGGPLILGSQAKIEYFGTVRGRLGVAFDRALVYVTGGYAFGQAKVSIPGLLISDDNMHNGYTVGGGIEYAFTNNISLKGEYLYVNLEDKNFTGLGLGTAKAGAEFSVVRAGVNYRV
jgi:outer membrane immunogenic protein